MIPIKGLVVCVEYDDFLAITLPKNARHLTEIIVVTSPWDTATQEVVKGVPSAKCFTTDLFYRDGAKFNKGAAIEQAFDAIGRDGWILIWDSDIILPSSIAVDGLNQEMLYGSKRRMLNNPISIPQEKDWGKLPLSAEFGHPGYFQLFNCNSSFVRSRRPWYATHSQHAGIGDYHFHKMWPDDKKSWLPFEVLHLGPRDVNWFGRASERLDGKKTRLSIQEAEDLFREHGWR